MPNTKVIQHVNGQQVETQCQTRGKPKPTRIRTVPDPSLYTKLVIMATLQARVTLVLFRL